jgi:uncharacterized membrane protein
MFNLIYTLHMPSLPFNLVFLGSRLAQRQEKTMTKQEKTNFIRTRV